VPGGFRELRSLEGHVYFERPIYIECICGNGVWRAACWLLGRNTGIRWHGNGPADAGAESRGLPDVQRAEITFPRSSRDLSQRGLAEVCNACGNRRVLLLASRARAGIG